MNKKCSRSFVIEFGPAGLLSVSSSLYPRFGALFWTFPLERRTHLHLQSVVWARPSTGAKLVGSPWKGKSTIEYMASKAVVRKKQGEGVCRVHLPLNFYRLTVLLLSESYRQAPRQSLVTLLWRGGKPTVCRQVCYQRPHNGGLGIPNLKSH